MKKVLLISLLIIMSLLVQSQGITYTFDSGADGWTLLNSLSGSVSGGSYNLTITGSDPYMASPSDLGLSASDNIYFRIKVRNGTNDNFFQLFWVTNSDNTWNQQKSYIFDVVPNDDQIREYSFIVASNSGWSGTIRQIRLDPGNNVTAGTVQIDEIAILPYDFSMDNGIIKVKQDLTRGGAINYISVSSNSTNIVNIHDEGRYVQQSYYAGISVDRQAEGQSPSWSPWPWNPIQVGDCYMNRAQILEFNKSSDTTYVKCIPMQWDMNNMAAEATMEQWTILQGNVIKVVNKLTCYRTDDIYGEGYDLSQELPAVYPISSLCNLYSYAGNNPFTYEPVENLPVVNLSSGFWGIYDNNHGNAPSEKWMAFVDDDLWGIGVYTPVAQRFLAGMSGTPGGSSSSASTSYIAPTKIVPLYKNSVFEYEYYLVVGDLEDIRLTIYTLYGVYPAEAGTVSADAYSICSGEQANFSISGDYLGNIQWQSSPDSLNWTDMIGETDIFASSGAITEDTYFRAKFTSGPSTAYSNVIKISVSELPPTPVITLLGNVLHSDAPTGNQWYKDNEPISEATDQEYVPIETGDYHTVVSLSSGCSSDTSNHIYVIITDMSSCEPVNLLKVYPNPVTSELNIESLIKGEVFYIEIVDMLGQVLVKQWFEGDVCVQTRDFAKGIYFLRLKSDHELKTIQIIRE